MAHRWPLDFDGVLATYPAWKTVGLNLWLGFGVHLLSQPGAFLEPETQRALYNQVMRACDSKDSIEGGVISNEAGCDFDPNSMLCQPEAVNADCLTSARVDAVKALSSPLRWTYPLESGETEIGGVPFLSDARMSTADIGIGTAAPSRPMPTEAVYGFKFWEQWAKYFIAQNPDANSLEVDPLSPGKLEKQISQRSSEQDFNNPDLSAFESAGGKLIFLHGTADELVTHRTSFEFYKRMTDSMGEAKVKSFVRFYLIPGANHENRPASLCCGLGFNRCFGKVGIYGHWTD